MTVYLWNIQDCSNNENERKIKMDLLKYIDTQLSKIRQTKKKYDEAIEKVNKSYASEYALYGGIQVHLSPEQVEVNKANGREIVGKLLEERDAEVQKIIQETEEALAAEKKKAIQAYTAAEPVPTDEDFRRVEQLKDEYSIGENSVNVGTLTADMNFHVENETVYAFAYYLLAKKSMQKTPETEKMLQETYIRLFPQIQVKADELKNVEDAIKVFRSQVILYKFATNENISFAESVSMKCELQSLGYYDNPQNLMNG